MSSTPRSRSLSGMLFALLVIAVLVAAFLVAIAAGLNPATAVGRVWESFFPPPAVTEQGVAIRELYTIVFLMAAGVFFFVEGLILWTVLRYKRRPGDDTLPPQTHGNMLAEAVWTIIPTVIVGFLFVISWQTLNTVEAVSPQPQLKVRAVAAQFLWTFDYLPDDYQPGQDVTPLYTVTTPEGATPEEGGFVLPTGRTVHLFLQSPDVIHAFYVPQFLFKRDVVPGRVNNFEFTLKDSDAGNTFHGQCAELCGVSHNAMHFDVHAMTGADFDTWLEEQIAQANASPPPPPSGEPAPSGQPGPPPITITALNVAFDKTALTAPADAPFKIEFDNQDASIPHNVAIHQGSPTGPEVFRGEVFPGPAKKTYDVPPLAAGAYGFICSVHPNMAGTLTVE